MKTKFGRFGKMEIFEDQLSAVEGVTVEYLNDDCLINIFQYLTFEERIKIELVCQKWYRVAKLSWSNVKSLQFHEILPYRSDDDLNEEKKAKNHAYLIKVLQRCGAYLKELNINAPYCEKFILFGALNEISNYCQNINELKFSDDSENDQDANLEQLFDKNQNISKISLNYVNLDGKCFLKFNSSSIKELEIYYCEIVSLGFLYGFLANLKNLNKFRIYDDSDKVTQAINALIMSKCQNIFYIYINLSDTCEIKNLSLFLSKQTKIRQLKLIDVLIDQNFLDNLPTDSLEKISLQYINLPSDEEIIFDISLFLSKQKSIRRLKLTNVFFEMSSKNITEFLDKLVLKYDEIPSEEKLMNISLFLSKQQGLRILKLKNVLIDEKLIESQLILIEEFFLEYVNTQMDEKIINVSYFLAKHKNLQKLELFNVFMNENFIKNLPSEHLEELDFGFGNTENDSDSWDIILKCIDHFKYLEIFKATFNELKDSYLQAISQSMSKNIKKIVINFNSYLSSIKQTILFNRLQNLQTLIFENNSGVTENADIDNIFKNLSNLRNLKYLSIKFCKFSSVGLNGLSCLSNLKILEIVSAENEDEEFLLFISKSLSLEELKFSSCNKITNDIIKNASEIKVNRKDTKILKIYFDENCSEIKLNELKNEPLIVVDYLYNNDYE